MAQLVIGIGNAPNDGSGDPLRSGGNKTNINFKELYTFMDAYLGLGIYYATHGLTAEDVDNLDRNHELLPAPGSGKVIRILSMSCKITPSVTLDCGTQQLNVSYGTDTSGEDIGHFPNNFLESFMETVMNMVWVASPRGDQIYQNQPVSIGLSTEIKPTSGSATMQFYILYQIITL